MSQKITLEIRGLHCAGCVANVEKVLNRLEFIEEVSVSLTAEKINATVQCTVAGFRLDGNYTKV